MGLTCESMPHRMANRLRRKWCQPQSSWLWGQKRIVTPELLPVVFGNGRQLLAVRPIITRHSHFVVAIDSSIEIGGENGMVHDIMDDIRDELEDWFGSCGCCDCYDDHNEAYSQFKEWPTPCFSVGCEWWLLTNAYLRA